MKDQFGHGSNSKLSSKQGPSAPARGFVPKPNAGKGIMKGGFTTSAGVSSNAQAAQALMGALRKTQEPIHAAMRANPTGGDAS